ncbi:MAG: hypothetical protein LBH03_05700 [Holophagales bacterium]|nr:hypothetical protein [Holophagales bacterium]
MAAETNIVSEIYKRGRKTYEQNPFIHDSGEFEQDIATKESYLKSSQTVFVPNSGDLTDGGEAGFWHGRELDSTHFVKIFARGVKALKGLTSAGSRVFEVIYWKLLERDMVDKDQVYLAFNEVDQHYTPMGKATYTRGLKELIDKGLLAATPSINKYWLNHVCMWSGKRILFVQDYRLKDGPLKPLKPKAIVPKDQPPPLDDESETYLDPGSIADHPDFGACSIEDLMKDRACHRAGLTGSHPWRDVKRKADALHS